jgi:hypothetical protein
VCGVCLVGGVYSVYGIDRSGVSTHVVCTGVEWGVGKLGGGHCKLSVIAATNGYALDRAQGNDLTWERQGQVGPAKLWLFLT